jgi:hypothetical protein
LTRAVCWLTDAIIVHSICARRKLQQKYPSIDRTV